MKRNRLLFIISLSLLMVSNWAMGSIIITSSPSQEAIIGESYQYTPTIVTDPLMMSVTWSLDEKPNGMTINATTGVVSWTPTAITEGGKVTVKVANNADANDFKTQSYYVYVSDQVICDPDIVSYYKFDESAAPFADFVGGHDATNLNAGAVEDTIGQINSGINLKPTSTATQFLVATNSGQFNWRSVDSFSISIWFNARGNIFNSDQLFICRGGTNFLAFGLDGSSPGVLKPKVRIDTTSGGPSATYFELVGNDAVTLNAWHMMTMTYEGGSATNRAKLKLYLNGTEIRSAESWVDDIDLVTSGNLNIGWWSSSPNPFNGKLDDLIIYSDLLTPTEVNDLYILGQSGQAACSPGNFAPLFTAELPTTTDEDVAFVDTITYNDYDSDPTTLSALVMPTWLSLNTSTGILTGTPTNDNVGDTIITVNINDGSVNIEKTFNLRVNNVNDDPVITSVAPTAVNEDEVYSYTLTYDDVDAGDIVTMSAPGLTSNWLNFIPSTGVLSGTPTNAELGTAATVVQSVTLRVEDQAGGFSEETINITITNVNDAPVLVSQNAISFDEDTDRAITLADLNVTDVDDVYPDDFTVTVQAGSNYSFTGNTISPDENWNGTLTIPILLNDGNEDFAHNITAQVNSVNDLPNITSTPNLTAKEGTAYSYVFVANDVDAGDAVTYSYETKPDWLTFDAGSGALFGTPGNNDQGDHAVVLVASDLNSGVSKQTFTITVENTNSAPVITSVAVTTADDYEPYEYTLTATDSDPGDVLTFRHITLPPWLTFNASTQVLSGTPTNDHVGDNLVVLEVTDGFAPVEQRFTIVVGNTNSAPEITSEPTLTILANDDPYAYRITFTDVDEDDSHTLTATTLPTWLEFSASTGVLSGVPTNDDAGTHQVVLVVDDGKDPATQSFEITVDFNTAINGPAASQTSLVSNVYPVPANTEIWFDLNLQEDAEIQILSISGKVLIEERNINSNQYKIDLQELNKGLYIYRVKSGNLFQTGKFTIQ